MSRGRKFWEGMLADVLAYQPRTRRNPASVCGTETSTGEGCDGRERGRLTGLGASFYAHGYHTGLSAYRLGGSDGYDTN